MNKKVNTILFILGATLFNLLVTILSFLLLLLLYAKFIMRFLPESASSWSFPLIFVVAMAIAFISYRYLLRFLLSKIEVEKYFEPIFARKSRG